MTARDAQRGDELTDRERQVLLCLARGLSIAEIGRELFLSHQTIAAHVREASIKLGARTRTQAVYIAVRADILGLQAGHGTHGGYTRHVAAGEDPYDCPHGCVQGEFAHRERRRAARTTAKESAR